MIIEELKEFNKEKLGSWNIVSGLHPLSWNIFLFFLIGLNSILFMMPLLMLRYPFWYLWYIGYIPCVFSTYFLINFARIKNLSVMQHTYNETLNLTIQADWDQKIIHKIEYLLLSGFIKSKKDTHSKDDIRLIIDSLKFERSQPPYTYISINLIVTFLSVFAGAFLGSIFNLGKDVDQITSLSKVIMVTGFYVLTAIVYVEIFILKVYTERKQNKEQRLIRALENYSFSM